LAYIKNLNYKIENFSLTILDLKIKENTITVLMGPSGSGKTTLFNLITGFIPHKDWTFEIGGVDLAKLSIEERQLGVVFQSHELFPHLTARENVELVMKSRNNSDAAAVKQLEKYKTILQLESCWNTKASVLSGGEKQRISLLRALMSKPRMLLLDEPFSSLDEHNKEEARKTVKLALEEAQMTALLISHDPKDAQVFGPELIQLAQGQINKT
jgi:ABC-type Fe3+/spermidine/putrescine transport system ATPase subunit